MSALKTLFLLVPALIAAVVLDAFVLRATGGMRVIDPFLVIAVAFAIRGGGGRRRALVVGGLAGAVQDFLASGVFGVHYLGKLVVAYVASMVSGRQLPGQALTGAALTAGGFVLEQVVVALLGWLTSTQFRVVGWTELAFGLVGNVVFAFLVFSLLDRIGRPRRPGSPRGL